VRLDGINVIRTNLKAPALNDCTTASAYKGKASPRSSVLLGVSRPSICRSRPIFPLGNAARACSRIETLRSSVVAKAQRSPFDHRQPTYRATPDGFPVHSL
jgi:hypothetical protein